MDEQVDKLDGKDGQAGSFIMEVLPAFCCKKNRRFQRLL